MGSGPLSLLAQWIEPLIYYILYIVFIYIYVIYCVCVYIYIYVSYNMYIYHALYCIFISVIYIMYYIIHIYVCVYIYIMHYIVYLYLLLYIYIMYYIIHICMCIYLYLCIHVTFLFNFLTSLGGALYLQNLCHVIRKGWKHSRWFPSRMSGVISPHRLHNSSSRLLAAVRSPALGLPRTVSYR